MKAQWLLSLLFILLLITGCGEKVPKSEYDALLAEYQELKITLGDSQDLNIKNGKLLNQILTDLSEISGNTMILRQEVESGTAKILQAERISTNITAIRNKIEKLGKQNNGKNNILKKTIQNLSVIIEEKEKEIIALKKVITEQEDIIREKESLIQDQGDIINQKEAALRQAVQEQASLLYQAGCELEKLAKEAPEVSKKKNKKKIDLYQKRLLLKALFYYQKAYSYGYVPARDDSDRLNRQLNVI